MMISYKHEAILKALFITIITLALFLFVINSWEYLKLAYISNSSSSPRYFIFYLSYALFNFLPWFFYFYLANKFFFYDESIGTIFYSNGIKIEKIKVHDIKKTLLTKSRIILYIKDRKILIDNNMQNVNRLYEIINPGVLPLPSPNYWKSYLAISAYNAIFIMFVNFIIFWKQILVKVLPVLCQNGIY